MDIPFTTRQAPPGRPAAEYAKGLPDTGDLPEETVLSLSEKEKHADEVTARTEGASQQNGESSNGSSALLGDVKQHTRHASEDSFPTHSTNQNLPSSADSSGGDIKYHTALDDDVDNLGKGSIFTMHKFSIYMTASRFYIVGGDLSDGRFRVLKIDRVADASELSLAEDGVVYSKSEMNQLLSTIDDGNRNTGGLRLKCSCWGLLGFIRFTGPYYMLLVTKRSQVAMIGGHYIYQIDGTELIPLTETTTSRFKPDRHPEEARFLSIFYNLDLTKSFYFSYTYDITRTLQHNMIRARERAHGTRPNSQVRDLNDMFVWNHYLLEPVRGSLNNTFDWFLPIVHGYVDQACLRQCYSRIKKTPY
jgi:hypothetical protein